ERGGLRIEALVGEVVGDLAVLRDRFVGLVGAHVEVAQRVARVPVARLLLDEAHVFRDGKIELAGAEELLRLLQHLGAVTRHGSMGSRSYPPGSAAGTCAGAPRNNHAARRRRGDRAWRSPYGGRTRSAGRRRGAPASRGRA